MPRKKRLLVTGFEPFGGSPVNPSEVAAAAVAAQPAAGVTVHAAVLPVVGGIAPGSARAALDGLLDGFRPDCVLLFGEAHVRSAVSIERIAVNLRDYRIADNSGSTVRDEPVVPGAPDAHFATVPARAMAEAVARLGIPAELSLSAGTYLCNEVMFHVLHRAASGGGPWTAGFVHVPQLEEQFALRPADARPISREDLVRAAQAAASLLPG